MTEDVLGYWFDELGKDGWWTRSEETDTTIRARFLDIWEAQRGNPAAHFLTSPRDALAAVILFDQFPRNMHRGHADAFSTDHLALAIAKSAVDKRFDDTLGPDERAFLYMPFMHAESLDDQERSVALFTALGIAKNLDFARKHHDVIERFGRFPARNRALGRADRPGEAEAAKETAGW